MSDRAPTGDPEDRGMEPSDRVRVIAGDCREVIKTLADCSIDSACTDPPYALVSIQKRFGKPGSAPAQEGRDGLYKRASAGFMGKQWDTGDVAFDPAFWAEVLRVLKPGGHVLAFGGTRTYHRLAVAIEDAGFEIRDQIGWLYGSGFPKSHDVSKGIDKRGGQAVSWFGPWLREWREERGVTQKQIAALFPSKTGGLTGCVANWELGLNMPTPEQFNLICQTFGLPFNSIEEAEREIIGQHGGSRLAVAPGQGSDRSALTLDVTAPATDAARQWQGWGTALKPAWEPIVLARKPLDGTVAETVLQFGTGALNIDECRVKTGESLNGGTYASSTADDGRSIALAGGPLHNAIGEFKQPVGRWPANVIHDGSEEVVAAFPIDGGGGARPARRGGIGFHEHGSGTNDGTRIELDDGGSAARFFYSAKADADDRMGSKHPTVKPVDLMAYLCRLVTPPGGLVLDPFAGSGTTGVACIAEGFRAILIEREPEYIADIEARIAWATGEGASKDQLKSRKVDEDKKRGDDLPLFGSAAQ